MESLWIPSLIIISVGVRLGIAQLSHSVREYHGSYDSQSGVCSINGVELMWRGIC